MSILPIGVFDSGIGGLTVLRELLKALPKENFVYLGDTARLPYGTKSGETIFNYSKQNLRYLIDNHQVKCVVIACGSASSHFQEPRMNNIPIFNVISPTARLAYQLSANKHIGILATKATVLSKSYERALKKIDPEIQISPMAAPLLVPLAEEGWIEDPITNLICYRYVQPLIQKGIDTLILGCTHYPILKASIQKISASLLLIDSGQALALQVASEIACGNISGHPENSASGTPLRRRIEILTTDFSEHFRSMTDLLLPADENFRIQTVDLQF